MTIEREIDADERAEEAMAGSIAVVQKSIANAFTEPRRIQRSRAKGWKMPKGAIYVGRPTRWGNPFVVGEEYVRPRMTPGGGQTSGVVVDAAHAVRLFRRFTARESAFLASLEPLRGRDLACWFLPGAPCHADVLLEIANRPRCEEVKP